MFSDVVFVMCRAPVVHHHRMQRSTPESRCAPSAVPLQQKSAWCLIPHSSSLLASFAVHTHLRLCGGKIVCTAQQKNSVAGFRTVCSTAAVSAACYATVHLSLSLSLNSFTTLSLSLAVLLMLADCLLNANASANAVCLFCLSIRCI